MQHVKFDTAWRQPFSLPLPVHGCASSASALQESCSSTVHCIRGRSRDSRKKLTIHEITNCTMSDALVHRGVPARSQRSMFCYVAETIRRTWRVNMLLLFRSVRDHEQRYLSEAGCAAFDKVRQLYKARRIHMMDSSVQCLPEHAVPESDLVVDVCGLLLGLPSHSFYWSSDENSTVCILYWLWQVHFVVLVYDVISNLPHILFCGIVMVKHRICTQDLPCSLQAA